MEKYQLPEFLKDIITQKNYEKWLHRKAYAHVRRDRNRENESAIGKEYKIAIHSAVQDSNGLDAYTGEELDWKLISKYDNKQSQNEGRKYKKKFALLPSIDHVGDGTGRPEFKICAWRTNSAKSDLSYEEFVELCRKIIKTNEARC